MKTKGSSEEACTEFIKTYISNHELHLGGLNDREFKTAMDAITKAMVAAWLDGYYCELR